jgi:hypothetical protein
MKKTLRAALIPLIATAALLVCSASAYAAPVAHHQLRHSTSRSASPEGTPTGCPAPGNLCSYVGTGGAQGPGNICFSRGGNVPSWGALSSPSGLNCQRNSGALVNTHTAGLVYLFEEENYSGDEAILCHGSYFADTNDNHYPNGNALYDRVYSSMVDYNVAC